MTRTDGLGTLLNVDGLVSVKELAARWGVTRDTARQRTLDAGFPQVIHLGPRLLRWRLEQVLQTGSDPGSRVAQGAVPNEDDPEVEADSIFDIEEYARTRVQTLIQENFAGHDLTRLVAAILTCEGFICESKPPGADGGVDILAGQGALGLDSPRLVVQVKSEPSPVGDPVVQTLQGALTRFNADQALLVAWGA